eukprot:m.82797 g.82797  ORF g.82797 m.82797 type:complete len:67 (-) comp12102_c0_seq2:81-281(-)
MHHQLHLIGSFVLLLACNAAFTTASSSDSSFNFLKVRKMDKGIQPPSVSAVFFCMNSSRGKLLSEK